MGFKDWLDKITGRRSSSAPAAGWSTDGEPIAGTTSPAPPTEADILAALDRLAASVSGGVVPAVVASRVAKVSQTIRDTMPRLRNLGLGSLDAYSVMATATDYLPEAIGAYTRLPRQWADSRPIENGKTSLMLLIDQLDLLGATMDKIFDAVVRVDADALIAHGRFLQEKFGHASSGGTLNLGDQPPPPPAQQPGPAMSSDRGLEATLRAAYSSALERIAALRSAQEGIRSAEPGAVNPLDLSQLDPLTPGAFPGIGTPTTAVNPVALAP